MIQNEKTSGGIRVKNSVYSQRLEESWQQSMLLLSGFSEMAIFAQERDFVKKTIKTCFF